MGNLNYTLLADGPTDIRLTPVLSWLLREHLPQCALDAQWADLTRLPSKPQTLTEKMLRSIELYPCDVLFIHRDAENESYEKREDEILSAKDNLTEHRDLPAVCVIPVRMQEAWLLFDEPAIRKAASNPNGREKLGLPNLRQVEQVADPKAVLHEALRTASGLSGRRRSRVPVARHAYRVAELIDDFSPLRSLPSFQRLERDLVKIIDANGWNRCITSPNEVMAPK